MALAEQRRQDPLAYADMCGRGEEPDISGFATLSGNKSLQVLIYNHHDDWDLSGEQRVELDVENLPFGRTADAQPLSHRSAHSNAYAEWLRQGRPMYPALGQRAAIEARDGLELLEPPRSVTPAGAALRLSFAMPVHAVSLLVLSVE